MAHAEAKGQRAIGGKCPRSLLLVKDMVLHALQRVAVGSMAHARPRTNFGVTAAPAPANVAVSLAAHAEPAFVAAAMMRNTTAAAMSVTFANIAVDRKGHRRSTRGSCGGNTARKRRRSGLEEGSIPEQKSWIRFSYLWTTYRTCLANRRGRSSKKRKTPWALRPSGAILR